MPELIAKAPLPGQGPVTKAGVTLAPVDPGAIWSIALRPGAAKAADKLLNPMGLAFPGPGEWRAGKDGARIAWTGRDQAFLIGAEPPEGIAAAAAVTDQSDGWACLSLTGPGTAEVLARLVPVDLREGAFPPGRAIRAPLNHMSAIILRTAGGVELFVFRSMARTAWHELAEVLDRLEARTAQKV